MVIDMSLNNEVLYRNCAIEEISGRLDLNTPVPTAIAIVGRNIRTILATRTGLSDRESVTLTGPMAVWAYLIVLEAVLLHDFRRVLYDDGRNEPILISSHDPD